MMPAKKPTLPSLRTRLVGLVAMVLIPILIFGGFVVSHLADAQRELLERNAETKVRQAATDIDREVDSEIAMLNALASSHFLQIDDFAAFHRQSSRTAQQLDVQIVLSDAQTGRQIVNTSVPWGQTLPADSPKPADEARQEAVVTGRPTASSVFYGPVATKFLVGVGIPILRNGIAVYYLAANVPARIFADAVKNSANPSQWIITLIDRQNTIIARSERQDEVVGTKARSDIAGQAQSNTGLGSGVDRFGISYRWVWLQSPRTGWFVAVSVPLSAFEAPRSTALIAYGIASGSLLVLAIAIAFFTGTRISRSMGEMGIDREPTLDEFRILFQHTPNGELVIDDTERIVMANDHIEQYFGYSRTEIIGEHVGKLIPEHPRNVSPPQLNRPTIDASLPPRDHERRLYGIRKDGSEFPIETALNRIVTRNGSFAILTVIDRTERVQAEQALTAALAERDKLRRSFLQAQEAERLRLARELHDDTGQRLAAILMELNGIDGSLSDADRPRLHLLRKQLEHMGQSLHHVAKELRPAAIDELGLLNAVSNYISEWSEKFGIPADLHCGDEQIDQLPTETRTAIYRIIQEGLTNIAKHARGASSVSVVIDRLGDILQLTIEDDGAGFDAESS